MVSTDLGVRTDPRHAFTALCPAPAVLARGLAWGSVLGGGLGMYAGTLFIPPLGWVFGGLVGAFVGVTCGFTLGVALLAPALRRSAWRSRVAAGVGAAVPPAIFSANRAALVFAVICLLLGASLGPTVADGPGLRFARGKNAWQRLQPLGPPAWAFVGIWFGALQSLWAAPSLAALGLTTDTQLVVGACAVLGAVVGAMAGGVRSNPWPR